VFLLKELPTGQETILPIQQVWALWCVQLGPRITLLLTLFGTSYNRYLKGTGILAMHPRWYSDWFIIVICYLKAFETKWN
jgi:hypothetical protein